MTMHWSVAQIYSKRGYRITEEIQQGGKGVYQPSYQRHWVSGGKLSSKRVALMPGYLLVWGDGTPPKDKLGRDIDGLIRVLNGRVRQDEYDRLRLECDLGKYDDEVPEVVSSDAVRKRRRRPRRSKRARAALQREAA